MLLYAKDFQENTLIQKNPATFFNILNFFIENTTEKSQKKKRKSPPTVLLIRGGGVLCANARSRYTASNCNAVYTSVF